MKDSTQSSKLYLHKENKIIFVAKGGFQPLLCTIAGIQRDTLTTRSLEPESEKTHSDVMSMVFDMN